MTALSEVVTWLEKRCRWSAADTVWSNKNLDRLGRGTSDRFFHMFMRTSKTRLQGWREVC